MSQSSVWLAIFLIVGIMAGTAAGVLMWMNGTRPPAAVVAGGGCVIGVVGFLMAMADFVAA